VDGGTHGAHFVLAALAHGDAQPAAARWVRPGDRRRGQRYANGGRHDANAFDVDALAQTLDRAGGNVAAHQHGVLALNAVAWVEKSLDERAIIGEQQQPFAVAVQAAGRDHAGRARRQQIGDRARGVGVAQAGNVSGRLVQEQVGVLCLRPQRPAVHTDIVAAGDSGAAGLAHNGAVDADAALGNQPLGGPARGDARRGKQLVQAHRGTHQPVTPAG
jgi:hypothetical protein